jgi:hypothetical protein
MTLGLSVGYCVEVSDLGSAPLSGVTYSVSVAFR